MTRPLPRAAIGVTLDYLLAGALAAALWIGVGVLLVPLMLFLALAHFWAAGGAAAIARSHHRWLARHHCGAAIALILVLAVPLFALPSLMQTATTVLNTLAYAPHPIETLEVALPQLGLFPLLLFAFITVIGWLLVTLWISLRWAEGRAS